VLCVERGRRNDDSFRVMVMHIDAHQHFWRYDPAEYGWIDESMAALRRDFLPQDAAREMERAGVDACVAVQARQTLEETRGLLALADAHPFIAGVVGWVDLQADDARAQLEQFAGHPKLVGIRHIVQDEADDRFLLRPAFCRGVALLEEFGLAYDILVYSRHLPVASEFVDRFPRHRFVLDHLGKPGIRAGEIHHWARDVRRLAGHPNVFCKLSGLVTEADWQQWTSDQIRPYLDVAFESFGVSRPVHEREAVCGGNAMRFWKC
jgi:L-fuconolactonase